MEGEEDNPGFEEDAGDGFVFDEEVDAEEDARLIAEAEADFAAGRCMPHEEFAAWPDTWGKTPRVPPPKSWFKWSGLRGPSAT